MLEPLNNMDVHYFGPHTHGFFSINTVPVSKYEFLFSHYLFIFDISVSIMNSIYSVLYHIKILIQVQTTHLINNGNFGIDKYSIVL